MGAVFVAQRRQRFVRYLFALLLNEEVFMAILEKETGHYYKILYDECMIKGNAVIVAFEIYSGVQERTKEQARAEPWKKYANAMQERIDALYKKLIEEIEKRGLGPTDVISKTEENKVDRELYPDLRAIQDEMNLLEITQDSTSARFYKMTAGENQAAEVSPDGLEAVEQYGFDGAWLGDPVLIAGKAQIYVGDYEGEPITHEFYYNRLKKHMSENIEDC
jgi:hypothetical protein